MYVFFFFLQLPLHRDFKVRFKSELGLSLGHLSLRKKKITGLHLETKHWPFKNEIPVQVASS